ncbi:hypothetical protein ACB272_27485 [Klebsiella pneumoniae]
MLAKQRQISFVKSHFSRQLEEKLGLIEVQAPILSRVGDGTQDNLSGCEKAVQVKVETLPRRPVRSGSFAGEVEASNPGTTRLQRGRRAVHAHESPSPR